MSETSYWPALPLDAWRETYATLHMWTQIVGKVRLALTPLVNHWWNRITREAYSHECISHGFWPGGAGANQQVYGPVFYSYTTPEPAGIRAEPIRPAAARFDANLAEFILPYDAVRTAASPQNDLMEFLQSTYEAGAKCAGWNRGELDK